MPTPQAEKRRLRDEMKTKLAAFATDPAAAAHAAERMTERVLALPEVAAAQRVFTCLSFGDEIDTWGLARRLAVDGREVYVPRADPEQRLTLHRWPCDLVETPFGLRQPAAEAEGLSEEEIAKIEVALILGLAFDRHGHRLGYGAGYFDRFLAGKRLTKIGLAYDFQVVGELPVEDHDVGMGFVVSDADVLRTSTDRLEGG